jgi:hypothetical protein
VELDLVAQDLGMLGKTPEELVELRGFMLLFTQQEFIENQIDGGVGTGGDLREWRR